MRITKALCRSGAITCVIIACLVFSFEAEANVVRSKLNVEPQNDFVVTPGKAEVVLNPGDTVVRVISVVNRINRNVTFTLSEEDFVGSDDANSPIVLLNPGEDSPYSLKDFVEPEVREFTLEFGEEIKIPVRVSVPSDMEPGGHYGAVVVTVRPPVDENGSPIGSAEGGAQITSRVASLFLVRVNGDIFESGKITSFTASGDRTAFWYNKLPDSYTIGFNNDGSVHLVPYGTISITNMFGKMIARMPVDAYFALPESTRYRQVGWSGKSFGLGRYTAELSLYKGYGNQTEERKITFWVVPTKLLIGVFLVVFIILYIIYYISSRFEFKRK